MKKFLKILGFLLIAVLGYRYLVIPFLMIAIPAVVDIIHIIADVLLYVLKIAISAGMIYAALLFIKTYRKKKKASEGN